MKKDKLEQFKTIMEAGAYVVFMAVFLLLGIKYYDYDFVDWGAVSGNMDEIVESFGDSVDCKVEYQDFYYAGLCTEEHLEIIFNFLNTTKNIHEGD